VATWTSADLAEAVLRHLGILGAGQSASPEDTAVVTDAWPSLFRELRERGVAPWREEAIGVDAQHAVKKWVAAEVMDPFHLDPAVEDRVRAAGERALQKLYLMARSHRTTRPIRVKYY
jgi:hypothetical protein